jgi:hypothetical protein
VICPQPVVIERIGLNAAIEVRAVYGSLSTGQLFNRNLPPQTSMNSVREGRPAAFRIFQLKGA